MSIQATNKLYYHNTYWRECNATVLEMKYNQQGEIWVALDQTVMYPTGGGQPHDSGHINHIEVIDVEEEDGVIWHRLAESLPEGTKHVTVEIDWERRFDHMQQHAGQHILSAAFEELYQAETIGFHLGKETCTIDLVLPEFTDEMARKTEYFTNELILENREINARFVTEEDLDKYPLRKKPSGYEQIRLVIIPELDYNPCGGTHPQRTGEVGPLLLIGYEKYKGGTRVHFAVGKRVIRLLNEKHALLKSLSKMTSAPEEKLQDSIQKLQDDRKRLEQEVTEKNNQILEIFANQMIEEVNAHPQQVAFSRIFEGRSIAELQKIARLVIEKCPQAICTLVGGDHDKQQIVCARGEQVSLEMNKLLAVILQRIGGKGGGSAQLAQGGASSEHSLAQINDMIVVELQTLLKED
ncbi:alanyl-tRNA editing protein [Brevibacillus daliensis]|uniref:alanyl-tRNA editing protein n=1 Tax=Brevibacillus daliensis TaxID=2892995 RepID=UPI001E65C63F|nr:DHHA1 domain-containing protein [Brevibacillus daliensis]